MRMLFMKRRRVVSLNLSTGTYCDFITRIIGLGVHRMSSYVCIANVHMTIEAFRNKDFEHIVNNADIVTPDGMPLAKGLKMLYGLEQERVSGMDLMPDLIKESEKEGLSIYFLGSTIDVLEKIRERIYREHPQLKIAGFYSPPFRQLTKEEEIETIQSINLSGANIVFVALGCPKQETWMAKHKEKINAVMIGLGGAFPVYSGLQRRAPVIMQNYSLEWLFRL